MDHHDGMSGLCIRTSRGGGSGGSKCGRWNPTAEQVKVLTDLFRAGLRTPTTEQIQKISCQLSFYGKIESKNVFYWFQNHKARERQKRRRVTTHVVGSSVIAAPPPQSTQYSNSSTRLMDLKVDHEDTHVVEDERSVLMRRETLQLFPLNSMIMSQPPDHQSTTDDHHDHKFMIRRRSWQVHDYCTKLDHHHQINNNTSSASFGHYIMDHHHPPLDLRLSFM